MIPAVFGGCHGRARNLARRYLLPVSEAVNGYDRFTIAGSVFNGYLPVAAHANFRPRRAPGDSAGTAPVDASGRPLNLSFETGTLADWRAEGSAFANQPVEGDTVSRRRGDMRSGHEGRFWVGSYEKNGDAATGTLISSPFRLTKPFATFMVGGGSRGARGSRSLSRVPAAFFSGPRVTIRKTSSVSSPISRRMSAKRSRSDWSIPRPKAGAT